MAQEYGVYEDWKNLQTKNQKISSNKFKKTRKFIKKEKLSKKIEPEGLILRTQSEISTKKEKLSSIFSHPLFLSEWMQDIN